MTLINNSLIANIAVITHFALVILCFIILASKWRGKYKFPHIRRKTSLLLLTIWQISCLIILFAVPISLFPYRGCSIFEALGSALCKLLNGFSSVHIIPISRIYGIGISLSLIFSISTLAFLFVSSRQGNFNLLLSYALIQLSILICCANSPILLFDSVKRRIIDYPENTEILVSAINKIEYICNVKENNNLRWLRCSAALYSEGEPFLSNALTALSYKQSFLFKIYLSLLSGSSISSTCHMNSKIKNIPYGKEVELTVCENLIE